MAQDPTSPLALVVEDDAALAALLRYNLEEEGFRVQEALDGPEALALSAAQPPRIVLLDWMLPTLSGLEVCRRMRADARFHGVPIIIVTARNDDRDMIRALEAGADDYVTKPFSIHELLARAAGFLRRRRKTLPDQVTFGEWVLDRGSKRLTRAGQPVELTPKEYGLLEYFVRNQGRALTRDQILDAVWGGGMVVADRSVDRAVTTLRAKIEDKPHRPRYIQTVPQVGYRFEA